ncbi:MAG: HEAT repeat domain-containing protein, partial [bacterium]
ISQEQSKAVSINIEKSPVNISPKIDKKTEEIKSLVEQLADDNVDVSLEAANKLVSLNKDAVPILLQKLKDAPVRLKGQIVFLLGRIKDNSATTALTEILKDDNAYIRRNAAEALGKIADLRALNGLTSTLFDEDISVRERSALALAELKDSSAGQYLTNRLKDEKEERVKSAVVDSLGKLKDKGATEILLKELQDKNDLLYQNSVVFSLGEIGDKKAIADLTAHINKLTKSLEELKKEENKDKPEAKMIIFQLEEAIKIADEAIRKIQQ